MDILKLVTLFFTNDPIATPKIEEFHTRRNNEPRPNIKLKARQINNKVRLFFNIFTKAIFDSTAFPVNCVIIEEEPLIVANCTSKIISDDSCGKILNQIK